MLLYNIVVKEREGIDYNIPTILILSVRLKLFDGLLNNIISKTISLLLGID